MKKKDYIQLLDESLIPFMLGLGFDFKKTDRRFVRNTDDAIQAISVDITYWQSSKTYRIDSWCNLSFPSLTEVYLSHYAYGENQKVDYVANFNSDNIFSSEVSSNLYISEDDKQSAIHNLKIGLEVDLVPFLNKYSDIRVLMENMDSSDWKNRITSDQICRAILRLSYHALNQSKEKFDHATKDFLEYVNRPHAVAHKDMAEALISGIKNNYFKNAQPVN